MNVIRSMPWNSGEDPAPLLTREWLVTNGLGGYASGTLSGVPTRRYHGHLIAALPSPHGRTMMLSGLDEHVAAAGTTARLAGVERIAGGLDVPGAEHLREFRLELGLPVWTYEIAPGVLVEKRVLLVHLQNTAFISYTLLQGKEATLTLNPAVHFRSHDAEVNSPVPAVAIVEAVDGWDLQGPWELPMLSLRLHGAKFNEHGGMLDEQRFRIEEDRGYAHRGTVWSPGSIAVALRKGQPATLVASCEPAFDTDWSAALSRERERRQSLVRASGATETTAQELVLAADQFVIVPSGRPQDQARARAAGDEVRSVIAGYHWFTDWGRDTMISLEGLTLSTGRHLEAGYILRTFAHYERDGLIPNMFPEGKNEGLYHTADATLWFFHALARYLRATNDRATLRHLLPTLHRIAKKHLEGTRFGIRVDPADGLLHEGEEGVQLTWMDAKFGDWVVTPRRGKAVEINALWYNALRHLETFCRDEGDASSAAIYAGHADRARQSFNARFWNAREGHLYDVLEPDDAACRPNQIFAVSLDHPVLEESRWAQVVDTVQQRLLTPVGLRSLAPGHPDYKPTYHGDLGTRDAAYHQGTVWSWLIGPFVDAFLRVHPGKRTEARALLKGLEAHLGEAGIGTISEVFDAEAPFTARGCIAQAWGVAETLRAWLSTT